jgi:mediator of RNA polymerase II transcription subunit 18
LSHFSIPNPLQTDPQTELPIPAHDDTLWEVEVKTAQPIRDTPVSDAISVLLEFQGLMKGLLDLRRQDM